MQFYEALSSKNYFHIFSFLSTVNQSRAVSPDVERKSSPSFPKSCPKSRLTSSASKAMVFTTAQKVTKYLGYFCNKSCCQEFPKIAQSGHTTLDSCTYLIFKRLSPWADRPLQTFSITRTRSKYNNLTDFGQWLWLSWLSSRFQYQRSEVRVLSSAKFTLNIVYCQLYWKDKNKDKEAGNGPFLKIISLTSSRIK